MINHILTAMTIITAAITALLAAATFGLSVIILAADYGLL